MPRGSANPRRGALAAVLAAIKGGSEELVVKEVEQLLRPRRAPAARPAPATKRKTTPRRAPAARPAPATKRKTTPRSAPTWLTPKQAGASHYQLWTARTASRQVVPVQLTSHRRPRGKPRRCWYGLNLTTGNEVRIIKLLHGSKRRTKKG